MMYLTAGIMLRKCKILFFKMLTLRILAHMGSDTLSHGSCVKCSGSDPAVMIFMDDITH